MKFEPVRAAILALALAVMLAPGVAAAADAVYRLHVAGLSCPYGTVFAVDFGNRRVQKWRPIEP